ncbi:MAG: membrane dipeptidase [Bacteroidetes bacterium]|nr:membrane dipeptidase [Bacteroidota bacterium]MCH8032287.1 membrane dipeptidase [Bacteroidota bacterium]
MYDAIEQIHQVTGSYDNIALGSDFNGFTDPPDDLKDCSIFPDLVKFFLDKDITNADLKNITSGNILRVLEEGWGKIERIYFG